mgnify:CR=1 FL=1
MLRICWLINNLKSLCCNIMNYVNSPLIMRSRSIEVCNLHGIRNDC